jgi:hypothetical protein
MEGVKVQERGFVWISTNKITQRISSSFDYSFGLNRIRKIDRR